jgi:putative membrane protein
MKLSLFNPAAPGRRAGLTLLGLLVFTPTNAAPLRGPALVVTYLAAEPLAADSLRPTERTFLEKAMETSRQQARLADVGASQANSSEVRTYALQLAADYRDLSGSLDALVRRKGGIAGAPVGTSSESYQKLSTRAGNEFDREYVRLADELCNSVMRLFEQAANNAKDPDVREFASAQLPLLRGHQNRSVELKKIFE